MKEELMIPEIIENSVELLPGFTREDIVDLRASIDPSQQLTWSQLKNFLELCTAVNLDPRRKHIYAIPRWNKNTGKMDLTTVTSIDGLRLVAERTGRYAPGKSTQFVYNPEGVLIGATVFVKKMTSEGTWHEVSETAFIHEYKPKKPNNFWDNMPSVMISKVAEARALRRAFPDTFSGIYGEDEMKQADVGECEEEFKKKSNNKISKKEDLIDQETFQKLEEFVNGYQDLRDKIKEFCCISDLSLIKKTQLEGVKKYVRAYRERIEKQKENG